MSKKDYELIAGVIRDYCAETGAEPNLLADLFAAELWAHNTRFDASRFRSACKGEDSTDSAGRKVRYSA
jgi:hypothetical protein